jgi:hypothetical protein
MKLNIFLLISLGNAGIPSDGFIESQEELQSKLKFTPIVFEDVKYEEFYLETMQPAVHDWTISNEEVEELNKKWLAGIGESQKTFINSMINTWKTVPLQSAMLSKVVDKTEFCWVVLVYNSDDAETHEALRSLLFAMSKHLIERAAVGSLDLAYPANAVMFNKIFPDPLNDTPAILIRAPNAMNSMLRSPLPLKDVNNDPYYLLDDVQYFGEVIPRKTLINDLDQCFKRIMDIYKSMSGNIKITSIFMEHYNDRGKTYILYFIRNFQEEIIDNIKDELEEQGLVELEDFTEDRLNGMTLEEITKYKAVYERELTKGLQMIYSGAQKLFQNRLKKDIQDDHDGKGQVEGKRPNFHPKVRRSIEPLKQIPADPFLHEWNEYAEKEKLKYKLQKPKNEEL